MFMLCVFMLAGCGSVNYSLSVSSTGVVTQSFYMAVNKTDIISAGKTVDDFKDEVRNVGNQITRNSFESFESRYADDTIKSTFDGGTKTYAEIKTYVIANMEPNNKTASIVWKEENGYLYCQMTLKFLTIQSYNYYYDHFNDDTEDSDTITIDYGYYKKEVTTTDSVFSDLSTSSIATYFKTYFGDTYDLSDMTYSYCYVTPSSHLYSDADSVSYTSSGYVHTWNFTADELSAENGGQISLYTISFRTWLWYVTAILITLLVGLILFLVCKIKDNKNHLKKQYNGEMLLKDQQEIAIKNAEENNVSIKNVNIDSASMEKTIENGAKSVDLTTDIDSVKAEKKDVKNKIANIK